MIARAFYAHVFYMASQRGVYVRLGPENVSLSRLRREDVRARLRVAPNAESLYISLIDTSEASAA